MGVGNDLSRRSVLAAVSMAMGGGAVIGTGSAQERDPTDYDRPLTMTENGIEATFYDCSRVIVDSSGQSGVNFITIGVSWLADGNQVEIERVDFANPELPLEFVVNCHRDEIGVEDGAATIGSVNVHYDGADLAATFHMPFFEWDCDDVRGQEVDPRVFEVHC